MEQIRVLIVEDEIIVARTIASQLKQLGYSVIGTASSGKSAITKALETKPELVLMDVIIKGEMDGITTAGHIHEQLDIPIIFLTAYGDEQTLERAKNTQPFGYVVKPFTIQDLRIAIELGVSQHKLRQELQENRDQLAALFHCMSDGVIATNEQAKVTFMNPAAQKITGWQQEEAIGQNISEILHIIDEVTGEEIENPVVKVLREKQVTHLQELTSLMTKDGKKVPIGDSASPLRRGTDQISGAVVVFWDLSARRKTEFLEKALKKEQELNRIKSLFISTVSHEFRNPLAMIQTAVELIEIQGNKLENKKINTYVNRIYRAIQSLQKLMEDVLFMGKVDAGYLDYNPQAIQLDKFCQQLITEFSLIENNVHEIIFNCHSQKNDAYMDETLLYYLLINLLSNATKYSPAGSQINFDLNCDSTSNIATFQITDQGIGIPEADQSQIFDSFYRASNAESFHGNGLGLVIAKKCVDAHNGKIEINSELGLGTTFTVTLPLGGDW